MNRVEGVWFNGYGKRIALSTTVLISLVLGGCNPAPKYARPPAQAPAAFKEAPAQDYKEGEGWKIAQPGDDKIRGKWWEIYNDPQLNALEEQVEGSNQSILASEANFRAARALVVTARSALFPTVGASPAYTNSRFSQTSRTGSVVTSGGVTSTGTTTGTTSTGTTGTTTTGGTGTTTGTSTGVSGNSSVKGVVNQFSLPVDVSYTVDLWHKIRNQVAANAYSAQASAADVATAILSIHAELAQDYFEVRALDAERQILDETVASYRQSLQLTQTLFNTGIDSEEEVAQAQTQLDTATAEATDITVSRATFEHALAILMGRPPATFSLPIAPFTPKPPDVPLALPSELLERRPDIAAAERTVASANAQVGVARAAYYPNLTLSASGGFQTSTFTQWFTWPSRFWSVGPQFAQTLFDAGARRGATEQAQAQYDAAVANYRQTVLTAFQAVEDNLSTLRILSEEVVQQGTAVTSSNRYLTLANTRFKAGVDSYLNVITAQTTVLTNRETELQLGLRAMTASVGLVMALGGGWDNTKLPQMKDLLVKPPKWAPATATQPVMPGAIAPPNPPPLAPQRTPSSTAPGKGGPVDK